MTETISANQNPALVNQAIEKAMAAPEREMPTPEIVPPTDNVVTLPGGYLLPTGEVITTAEVRELTGRDEEAISKATTLSRTISTLLARGTVKVGNEPVTESVLDGLLSGDRDAILLGVYKATFGPTADIPGVCNGCAEVKTVTVNVDEDVKVKTLEDPISDRRFTVETRKGDVEVVLPTGVTQKELFGAIDKSAAELSSILLQNTVVKINGNPVFNKNQVLNLGIADRRTIGDEIAKRNPGPQLQEVTVECPDCGGEVTAPVTFGALFRI